ncbi:aminoacyl-tRNA hydrolase [Candidatus Magnetaquicoccus inordinatus]|uniref:aminoacyl-tRNA hydrolase n=1 Tax=Candidatus Magnetaquicoccus inordinatus TaxID=2496818 RepID=UPI00102B6501|nr:aminoacyl-tRNA hydrolase [Candidatus Magnetaquicoccus inordinatus]
MSDENRVLLVGLGNPGEKYRETRHNLGWMAVEKLATELSLAAAGRRFEGRFGEGRAHGLRVGWLLPETYMNLAGNAVGAAARFFKLSPEQVIVFHDDLDLEAGRIRIKRGGGHGGHNGLRSIQQVLGSADFVRVRLGIGRPPAGVEPAHYVLSPFNSAERNSLHPVLDRLPAALLFILKGDLPGAMNSVYNSPGPSSAVGASAIS